MEQCISWPEMPTVFMCCKPDRISIEIHSGLAHNGSLIARQLEITTNEPIRSIRAVLLYFSGGICDQATRILRSPIPVFPDLTCF
jgi:hypothetical protein